jgi:hypothetical protein
MHPGAVHPKMPSFEPIFRRQQSSVFTDVAEEMTKHIEAAARG